jgi:hypothetical protein
MLKTTGVTLMQALTPTSFTNVTVPYLLINDKRKNIQIKNIKHADLLHVGLPFLTSYR